MRSPSGSMPLELISSTRSLIRCDDLLALPAGDHHDDAADRFGVAALDHGAVADFFAEPDFRHIADVDGRGSDFLQHDGSDVIEVFDQAHAAHQIKFRTARQDTSARIRVIASQRL